jgi:AcrR family transcriptional regulator
MVKVDASIRESVPPDTMNRILDAAEELFAEKGVAATSVRNITEKAGVNVAAVNYHFDSKENLIRSVIDRRAVKLDDGRGRALDAVDARAAAENRTPTVHELVDAMITPVFYLARGDQAQWQHFVRFISRIPWEPQVEELTPPDSTLRLFERFAIALERALPEPNTLRRRWRIAFMRAVTQQTLMIIATVQSGRIPKGMPFADLAKNTPLEVIHRELIEFITAGLEAAPPPAT